MGSLRALGFDLVTHDVRFVEDNWESPTLGAWGLGWEVWLNGMEISQFTYFQQVGGLDCRPVMGEITYGLERLGMYIQGKESIFDIVWAEGPFGAITYGDVFHQNEVEQSAYNFEKADTHVLKRQFDTHESACQNLLSDKLVLPAYEQMVKASHTFNLLDARHAVSVTERQRFILRVRTLARGVAEAFRESREALGFPLLKNDPRDASGVMSAPDLLFELGTEELPPRTLKGLLGGADRRACVKGLDGAGIAHGTAHGFATPRRLAVLVRSCAERAADRRVERRGPPVSSSFDAAGAPTQAAAAFARNCGVPVRGSRAAGHGEGRVAGVPRHRARRRDRRLARRHHQRCDCGAADREAHAMGSANRRVRPAGAQRRAALWERGGAGRSPGAQVRQRHVRPPLSLAPPHFAQVAQVVRSPTAQRQGDGGFRRAPGGDPRRRGGSRRPGWRYRIDRQRAARRGDRTGRMAGADRRADSKHDSCRCRAKW